MKIKILVLVLILCTLLTPVFAEDCMTIEKVLQERLNVRYNFAVYRIENHRIGMEALIEYLEENNEKVSELEDIKDDFISAGNDLQKAETNQEFESAVNDVKTHVLAFKDEARDLIDNLDEARGVISNAQEKEDDYLQGLLDDAYEKGIEHQVNRFEASVCRLQQRIDTFNNLDYDMSDAQLKLKNYNNYNSEIEDVMQEAQESCRTVALFKCDTTAKDDYDSLRNEIKEEFVKTRVFVGLEIAQGAVDKTKEIQAKLNKIGMDTNDIEDDLDSVQSKLDNAVDNYLDEDYDSAEDKMSGFIGDVSGVRQNMRESLSEIREGLRGDI